MELLENIQWYIGSHPSTAIVRDEYRELTDEEWNTILFRNNIILSFPLNDNYLFSVNRDVEGPITIEKLLKTIYNFYQEPLETEYYEDAFEEMEEWWEEILQRYDGDTDNIIKFDVFTDTVDPDFAGLDVDEEFGEYIVNIGPI
jgi:hypothetical protein